LTDPVCKHEFTVEIHLNHCPRLTEGRSWFTFANGGNLHWVNTFWEQEGL